MIRALIAALPLLLLALTASAQIHPSPGPGHVLVAAVGGSSCSSPYSMASFEHLYFRADSSWATAGDPDDETGSTPLADSIDITDSGNLSSADLPAGTDGAFVAIDLDGITETAEVSTASVGFVMSGAFGDSTVIGWYKLDALDSNDLWHFIEGSSNSSWVYANANGSVAFNTPGASSLTTGATGLVTAGTWVHVALVRDAPGASGAGFSDQTLYINGVNVASRADALDLSSGETATQGIPLLGTKVHEWAIEHGALTEAQIRNIACCSGGTADPTSRDAILGGAVDCSIY